MLSVTPLIILIRIYSNMIWSVFKILTALGGEMVGDGYQDVVNIDISSVVVEAMQQKYQDNPHMKCIH